VPQNEIVLSRDESGAEVLPHEGDTIEAEIANIDSQERRITLSMKRGEAAAAPSGEGKPARASKAPGKKAAAQEAAAGGTIGELIKQKLGAKLAAISETKDDDEDE